MVEMEDCMAEDILRPLSHQELINLRDLYSKHCPIEVHFYFLLKNQVIWDEKLSTWSPSDKASLSTRAFIKFYTPRDGDPSATGTFVAILNGEDPNIYFHSLREEPQQLLKYLSETKRIEWKWNPVFSCVSDHHLEILDTLIKSINREGVVLSDCSYYLITKEDAVRMKYEIPDEVTLKEVDPDLATLMNERWPHRYPASDKYIKLLIQMNGGLGLFSKANDDLVGWVLQNEFAGVGHLQIMPDYRKKGYGELLAKAMTKRIALEDDGDVNAFIVDKNVNSRSLFGKLGFKLIAGSNWIRAVHLPQKI